MTRLVPLMDHEIARLCEYYGNIMAIYDMAMIMANDRGMADPKNYKEPTFYKKFIKFRSIINLKKQEFESCRRNVGFPWR